MCPVCVCRALSHCCLCLASPLPLSVVEEASFCLSLTGSPQTITFPNLLPFVTRQAALLPGGQSRRSPSLWDMFFCEFRILETWHQIKAGLLQLWPMLIRYRKSHLSECVLITFETPTPLCKVFFCFPVWLLVLFSPWLQILCLSSSSTLTATWRSHWKTSFKRRFHSAIVGKCLVTHLHIFLLSVWPVMVV